MINQILPKVTIITVVLNSRDLLAYTIHSVDLLNYPNIEHVIVDGGSTDGVNDLFFKQRTVDVKIISERDLGIYDAMNKGINLATGDYLWFLNAGDAPADFELFKLICGDYPDVIYGDTILVNDNYETVGIVKAPAELTSQKMMWGMLISHQSIAVKREVVVMYDLSYRYIADQKWIVEVLRRSSDIRYLGGGMSKYLLGGISHKNYFSCLREKIRYTFSSCIFRRALAITFFDFYKAIRFYLSFLVKGSLSKIKDCCNL